jgi:starch phosphorylase
VLEGVLGATIPVYFLDSDLPENGETERRLTDHLYGGDKRYRLSQECVLGIGGLRMLRALGYESLETYHMNEGHSSLLTLELLAQLARRAGRTDPSEDVIGSRTAACSPPTPRFPPATTAFPRTW